MNLTLAVVLQMHYADRWSSRKKCGAVPTAPYLHPPTEDLRFVPEHVLVKALAGLGSRKGGRRSHADWEEPEELREYRSDSGELDYSRWPRPAV